MTIDINKLKLDIGKLGLECDESTLSRFDRFSQLLLEWNQKINLTSITDPNEIITKHFVDSLAVSLVAPVEGNIIDIGTGAGFPGIPLAIMFPDARFTLIDSLAKRIDYLKMVVGDLGLDNVICMHGRAEDLAHLDNFRQSFDLAVSRAVANISVLLEYAIPFVKVNGKFISYKSTDIDDELRNSVSASDILGVSLDDNKTITLPSSEIMRRFLVYRVPKEIDSKYPRKAGKPTKSPL